MHKFIGKTIKATIINVIVALFVSIALIFDVYLMFRADIDETISLISKVSIDIENKEVKETVMNEDKRIENYPEDGTQYATIGVPEIDVNLPVY